MYTTIAEASFSVIAVKKMRVSRKAKYLRISKIILM